MRKFFLGAFLFALTLPSQADVKNLSNAEFKQMMTQGVPIIDIRLPEEWQQTGIVEGSHLLTFFDKRGRYNLDKWMAEFEKIAGPDEPFILICRSGNRTGQVSQFLDSRLRFSKVAHVAKGINNWISAGEPTVKPGI
ncbi:MAG: rhodanese-like domain-containing protein [Gammaproteobacteria bacterium]|nr:rhodanese-like domain-containing protein [Gammaproteobacteria bacterium]